MQSSIRARLLRSYWYHWPSNCRVWWTKRMGNIFFYQTKLSQSLPAPHIAVDSHTRTFGVIDKLGYPRTSIYNNNNAILEIKRIFNLVSRTKWAIERKYGAETWTMRTYPDSVLGAFERKILWITCGPLQPQIPQPLEGWMYIIQLINILQPCWMDENTPYLRVFDVGRAEVEEDIHSV